MTRIGDMMRLYCRVHEISERELARQLGMPAATLHRFIHGKPMDFDNIMTVLHWLFEETMTPDSRRVPRGDKT